MSHKYIILSTAFLMLSTTAKAQDTLKTRITYDLTAETAETTQPSNLPPTDITCSVLGLIRPICVEPSTSLMLSTGT